VSAQRVRLFVDAALRRHDEEHAGAAQQIVRKPDVAAAPGSAGRNPALLGSGIAALLVIAALAYFLSGRGGSARTPLSGAAATAAAAASADARINKLLADTEQALVQGRISDAATLLDQARQLQPDNIRVAFLTGQLGKQRERSMLTRARAAAASGDFNQALAALDGPNVSNNNSSTLAETRRDLERQQLDDRVRLLLRQGNEYVQRGAIAVPEGANAVFQLEAARALAPRDPGIARLELAINARILAEARSAAARGDAAGTTNWLKLASERRLPAAEIDAVRSALTSAQGSARSTELLRLTTSVNDLIARGRNDDAVLDAAHTALAALRNYENNGPNTRDAQERLAAVMVAHARSLVDASKLDEAQKALVDAQTLGAAVEATAAVSVALAAQRERVRLNTDIVGANKLKKVKSPEPIYPSAALAANKQGWVDVVFLIRTDGSVTDAQVQAAEPAGVFEKAATDCLLRWRFEPVLRDGKVVEQRARLRVRFSIDR
jgi:TonB family protein